MSILFYSIAYDSIKNIENLYTKLTKNKKGINFLIVDHSEGKIDISKLNKISSKIVIVSEKNIGYSGAFNTAMNFARKNSFSHLVHINDDVDLLENTIENLVNNPLFKKNVLTGCELNSKKQIVSFGSKINFITGRVVWNKFKNRSTVKSFSIQGALFSIPIKNFANFKLLNLFMYCEELQIGLYMRNKRINCYALGNVKYIHHGAVIDNKISNFKIYYISRNNFIVFREMTNSSFFFYIFIVFTIRGILNFTYRLTQFEFNYAKYLAIGLLHGIVNRSGKYDFN